MEPNNNILSQSIFTFIIPQAQESGRLDKFLATQFPAYSRSFLQKLITQGFIRINNCIALKTSSIVKSNDSIEVQFPTGRSTEKSFIKKPSFLSVEIIHEEEHFLIINKPANLIVHLPHIDSNEPTLVDWVLYHYNEIAHVGSSDRPGIVHRLDKDTSGIMIIPRTPQAHAVFGSMFEKRTIQKTYLALVTGHPPSSGTIELPIGRSQRNKTKMATYNQEVYTNVKARKAITHYQVLEYFENAALVAVKPVTGRTHQIRVHLSSIGYPIIGDTVYGASSHLIQRQALHAASIAFQFNNESFLFNAQTPADFDNVLEKLRSKVI